MHELHKQWDNVPHCCACVALLAKEPYRRGEILQKRPLNLRSLLFMNYTSNGTTCHTVVHVRCDLTQCDRMPHCCACVAGLHASNVTT